MLLTGKGACSTVGGMVMLTVISIFSVTACTQTGGQSYNAGINIIPQPQSLTVNEGVFTLDNTTTFYAATPEVKQVAQFFAAKINASTGFPATVNGEVTEKNVISLQLDASTDVNDEGYTLDVTPEHVTVKAKTPQGLFYGMQSFLQLLPAEIESPEKVKGIAWKAQCVSVKDEPRFGYRGVMLDACRHFIPVESVKKQIDVVSMFKINRLHWHLTEDQGWRIEIKKYPKLTETGAYRIEDDGKKYGGFYTQEEIKDIVAYAAARFVTVVPEVEVPGHELAAIAAYPWLSCNGENVSPRIIWGVEDIVMCPGKDSTFAFLEDIFAEVAPLFPGEYFHIGGDECPKVYWEKCPLCQKRIRQEQLKDEHGLQSYVIKRVEKMLAAYGKKIIGWDEILEGGLAPSATVMSWRGEQGGIAAANLDHDVIMTPNPNGMYIDQYQGDSKIEPVSIGGFDLLERVYAYNPTPDTLVKSGKEHYIKGVQSNLWGEYLYTTDIMEYRLYPRILATSEVGWTEVANKDYQDFERRINNAYVRLDGHHINYHIPQPEQPNGSCNFVAFTDNATLTFKTSRPVKMVYTTDGSEPIASSGVYENPLAFAKNTTLKIRSVLPSGKMSPVRTITVEKQTLASAKAVDAKKQGLNMQYTKGLFFDVEKLKNVKNWETKEIKNWDAITSVFKFDRHHQDVTQYAAIVNGYVDVPSDGVYYFSSELEEVWIDGNLLIDNKGEVKRFSRKDKSVALARGLHEIKAVFLGNIYGGWPSNWNKGNVSIRKSDADKFVKIRPEQLFY
jgi:hexosaminidase